MEEVVYDTNKLIDFLKKGKVDATGFTTIINVIEFPKALELAEITVIFPTLEDYDESVDISLALLQKGNPLPAADILIAAMCVRRNLVLCTADNHFKKVESVRKGFKLKLAK